MTFKIEGHTYPNVGTPMLKHKKLGPILRAIMRSKMQQENYLFLDAVPKFGKHYSKMYWMFIDEEKAKHPINIGGPIRNPMRDAAAIGNFYDKKLWKKGIEDAVGEIEALVQANYTPTVLMENKAFRAYHNSKMWYNRASLYRKWKTSKEMKKVRKFLDVSEDIVSMEQLGEAYAALQYNPKESKGALATIANATGKKARDVKSAFAKAFRIR